MSVLDYPICPEDCESSLPPVNFDLCAPEVHYGEIAKIFIARADADDFTSVDIITEWTTRLTEDGTGDDDIRELTVIGELTEPEQTEVQISGDRTVIGFKQFTVDFEIDETNDTNYYFLLNYECDMQNKMWFETADGMLYGGNEGILGSLKLNNIIPRSREEVAKFMGTFKWKAQHSPLRCASPMV